MYVTSRPVGRRGGGGASAPPFWRQKTFLSVSFFRKLIVHENLYLKLFCSSKIVDFRAIFAKNSAVQPYFFHYFHIFMISPPLFTNASCGPGCCIKLTYNERNSCTVMSIIFYVYLLPLSYYKMFR